MNFEERKRQAKGPDVAEAFGMMAKELFDYANGCGFPTEGLLIEHLHGLAQEHYSRPAMEPVESLPFIDFYPVKTLTEKHGTGTNKTDKHIAICAELKDIYEAKNTDYGNSFAKQLEEYGLVSAAIRLEDKLNRFKHLIGNEAKVDESIQDTLMDLANYAVMTLIEMEEAE